jgi:flotillin
MVMLSSMAQIPAGLPVLSPGVVGVGLAALVLLSFVVLIVKRYHRCPANKVLVISGRVGDGKAARVISGGGAFVWPVIQQADFLSLLPLQIPIELTDALSLENIRVRVPSQVTVAVGDTIEYQMNAAARLLGLSSEEVKSIASNIIFGQMRQVIASMGIEEINRDRENFRRHIEDALEPELKKVGLKLINVNITDINDESGYIEAIGREAGARAVQKARGDVAEQEKLGEIRVAQAMQERAIAVANAEREREIGVKTAERDTAIKLAELDRETAVAQQRAAFARDAEIAEADQAKRIAIAAANAKAIEGEALAEQARRIAVAAANAEAIEGEARAQARIAAAEAELQVRRAEAYEQGETRKRVAEAAVQEAQNRALAKAAIAEAERVEAERRAELEAPAKAEKAKRIVEAEAAGESRRIQAEAEAAAILARLRAEAQGEYEKLAKKAEGLGRIVEACGGADQAYKLLVLEHLDHLAETAAKAMANVKFDKVVVWGGANGDGAGVGGFVRDLARVFPPVMEVMRDIGGVQLPESVLSFVPAESASGAGAPGNGERAAAGGAKGAAPSVTGATPEPLAEAASMGEKVRAGS